MGLFSSVGLALCRQFLRLLKERHRQSPLAFSESLSGIASPPALRPGLAEQRQSHMGVF